MPVYGYEVDDGNAAAGRARVPTTEPGGSWHVVDWFLTEGIPTSENQNAIFQQEIPSVTTFASSGQPRASNTPPWPQFTTGSIMQFSPGADTQVMPVNAIEAIHHCAFWDSVAPRP